MEGGSAPRFILASSSPRRRDLLRDAGYSFEVVPSRLNEVADASLTVRELTLLNALRKALDVARLHYEVLVLGADTLVSLHGSVIGKPANLADAHEILKRLSGRTHQVWTSFVVAKSSRMVTHCEISTVKVRVLSTEDIENYFKVIDPLDKAGAYAAQGEGRSIIAHIDGSFSNVVGLPMEAVAKTLSKFGVQAGN